MLKLTDVAGAMTQAAVRPVHLVQGLDSLLNQLGQVAARALSLLDGAEGLPGRIEALVGRAEDAATRVEDLAGTAAGIATKAAKTTAEATATVQAVQPLLQAVTTIDPAMVAKLEPLLEDVIALLPALASLPPVIERLAVQVDHLDQTVADVGALLQGIPGAGRIMKRAGTGPDRLPGR